MSPFYAFRDEIQSDVEGQFNCADQRQRTW